MKLTVGNVARGPLRSDGTCILSAAVTGDMDGVLTFHSHGDYKIDEGDVLEIHITAGPPPAGDPSYGSGAPGEESASTEGSGDDQTDQQ